MPLFADPDTGTDEEVRATYRLLYQFVVSTPELREQSIKYMEEFAEYLRQEQLRPNN
jgi:hypothetical protein